MGFESGKVTLPCCLFVSRDLVSSDSTRESEPVTQPASELLYTPSDKIQIPQTVAD